MTISSDLARLEKEKRIHLPKWLLPNIHYLVMCGSTAYGASNNESDWDVQGFCIPPKEDIFPHLRGEIIGFGRQHQSFNVWQEHHISDSSSLKEYDFSIYSIVKFFRLCMENNPNMLDILCVPQRCILLATHIGQLVRDNRKLFFHKGSFRKFRGYSFAQMCKIEHGNNRSNSKRAETIDKFGYDTKFLMHVVRLALEIEQLLTHGDMDLEANSEILKSIRRGDWTLEEGKKWFTEKELQLEKLYATSSVIPYSPNEDKIKALLLNCLESHYGNLSRVIELASDERSVLQEMQEVINKHRGAQ